MTPVTTYLFYDLETSGLNPTFDQILQFAAIRTDADFQELERHNFRIRLRPDIIPSPGALLATDISVLKAITTGRREYDAARTIHSLFNQPNTVSIGYNSLAFDDLFLRFTFYRNLLPVYTHQWQNGCGRLDLFPITVLYWLRNSPLLNWPELDGKPTLRLEYLSEANGLAEGQAHDALVDVEAAVALARRLRQDESLWSDCLAFFDKNNFADRLDELPRFADRPYALLVNGRFGYDHRCQVPALYLGQTNGKVSRSLWLRLDQPNLSQTTLDTIPETTWIIRKKAGEPPLILAPEPHHLSQERRQITRDNLKWVRQQPQLLEQIATYHLEATLPPVSPDLDAALYVHGFPSNHTESLCQQFHQADLPHKLRLLSDFQEDVYCQLAERLLCRNYGLAFRFPAYQVYEQQLRDETQPLLDYRGQLRLTPRQALVEIEAARQESLAARQQGILTDLHRYICYQFGEALWDS
jgi:exodeoxyribonuclease I